MSENNKCQDRAKKIEYKYVHSVYSSQASSYDDLCDGPWPEIENFLLNLPPGSFVADVGCGNGKYLTVRNDIVIHGVDICQQLSKISYERHRNIIIANNLSLPYRSSTMDAVISVGVLHHFASFERRLQSVKELERILKPGGEVFIYVWAWEQKQRKFSSQNVLIPWKNNLTGQDISGFCGNDKKHNIQQPNIDKRRTFFQRNGCLEQLSVTNAVVNDEDSRNANWVTSDDEKDRQRLENFVFIDSIRHFTADLKEKLRFSFSESKKSSEFRAGSKVASNSHLHSSNFCNSKYHVNVERNTRKDVLSVNSKQTLVKTEQQENWGSLNNAVLTRSSKRRNDVRSCNENSESSGQQRESFERFYHVFIKDELPELIECVCREMKVIAQNYDHGNWAVKAVKL